MNGIVEITVSGKLVTLQFGAQACMLFEEMALQNAMDPMSKENHVKLMCDLFHCGIAGYQLRTRRPVTTYDQNMDLFDQFAAESDFKTDMELIWKTWGESKWGSELIATGDKEKKKLEELEESQP